MLPWPTDFSKEGDSKKAPWFQTLDHLEVLVVDRNDFLKKPGKSYRSQFPPQHPSKMASHVRHDVHRQATPARPLPRSFGPQLILTEFLLPVPRVRRAFPVPSTSEPKKAKRHIMDLSLIHI